MVTWRTADPLFGGSIPSLGFLGLTVNALAFNSCEGESLVYGCQGQILYQQEAVFDRTLKRYLAKLYPEDQWRRLAKKLLAQGYSTGRRLKCPTRLSLT